MRATIASIARLAGVSRSTASHILRGTPQASRLAAATRQRVLELAQRGNRPGARAVSGPGQVGIIGLVLDHRELIAGFTALAPLLQPHGFDVMPVWLPDAGDWQRRFYDQRLAGVIAGRLDLREVDLAPTLSQSRLPVVRCNWSSLGEANQIQTDESKAGSLAVEHLLGLGHRQLLYVGPETNHHAWSVRGRMAAVQAACDTFGCSLITLLADGHPQDPALRAAVDRIDDGSVTGVITYDARLAICLATVAAQRDLRAPGRFSLIALDDCAVSRPVSVIGVPQEYVLSLAADRLLKRLRNDCEAKDDALVLIAPTWLNRGTTGSPIGTP